MSSRSSCIGRREYMMQRKTRKNQIVMVIVMITLMLLGFTEPAFAASAPAKGIKGNGLNGIYIDITKSPYTDSRYNYSNLAFTDRGCTCFAAARASQLTGKTLTVYSGKAWYNSKYANYGFTRGSSVRAKAFACYEGHVAVVERVDGNTVTVSEGGYRSVGSAYGYCYLHTMSVSSLESARNGKFLGYVYFDGSSDFVNPTTSSGVTFSDCKATDITQTNAVLRCVVAYNGSRPSSVGVCVSTDAQKLTRSASDPVNHSKNPFNVWYDLNKEAGMTLSAGVTYYYKFYAVQNGNEYYSEVKSFTTQGSAPAPTVQKEQTLWFSNLKVENLSATNAQPRCTISYTGTRPSSVGVCVSTNPNNLTRSASDPINHNKNPFDAWYDLNKEAGMYLSAHTTYYYKFYAVKDGEELYSDVCSFTTP